VFGWEYLDLGPTVEAMISVAGYGAHLAATADPDIYERQAGAPDGFENVIGAVEPTTGDEKPRWRVKFSVANRAASMELAESLGATVLGTDDQVWALLADIRDPQGAEFTISEFVEPG
jgi:predicted enzyme related to lactoylglutathione lyase